MKPRDLNKVANRTVKAGKLPIGLLSGILKRYTLVDRRVVVGPKIGEDAAVIDGGKGNYLVFTADPITFAAEEIGYYGVVVNLNDIATRGAIPRWFLATLLFPEQGMNIAYIKKVFRQIHDACRQFGVSFVGGHTEITPGISKVVLSGHMIGEVKKRRLVTTGGARPGDLLLLVKGVCIEGTSIIAREKGEELLKRGAPLSLVRRAQRFMFNPGIEVLRASRIACQSVRVHAMHDPTEGGLVNGIVEMALASENEIEVDLGKVFVYEESRILCQAFGLNPLGVIASGALLLTIPPEDLSKLQKALGKASLPVQVIGQVRKGSARVFTIDGKRKREMRPFDRDEILKIYT
jgi:hydrogenase maturation factor